jgi:mRNA interferase RelE/StbE
VTARYDVELSNSAARAFRKLDRVTQRRLARAIDSLALNPREGATKLSASDDIYRVRSGDYRILFTIQDTQLLVLVIAIGHRREVYR